MMEEKAIAAFSLGRALALLHKYPDCCRQLPSAYQHWHEFLHPLRERRESLQKEAGIVAKTLHALPEQICDAEQPLLANNADFFLIYILVASNGQANSGECFHLFRHLNGCYLCFEEYKPVLRDYSLMLQDLGGNTEPAQALEEEPR